MTTSGGAVRAQASAGSARVRARLAAIFGRSAGPASGVLHVCSAARDAAGRLRALRIGPTAPASALDRFALGAARARADWVLTSGSNLRAEPELDLALHPDPGVARDLAEWRRAVARCSQPLRAAVLTRGSALEPIHPLFATAPPALLFVPRGARNALPLALRERCEVRELTRCDARAALDALHAPDLAPDPAALAISVELGPSTATPLYTAPCRIAELWLSVFDGELPDAALAGALPSEASIEAALGAPRFESSANEASGRWRFRRYALDAEAAPNR